jgi:7-cyano-7-deazaguanine synthase
VIDNSAIVLFSGGQDSTVSLLWACINFQHVETIGFDYNQRHLIELECRKTIIKKIRNISIKYNNILGEDHLIDIQSLGSLSETSLTRDSEIIIEENGLPNTFVPGRNLLFFIMASALGWRRNIFNLVGGMCDTDYSGYPDCRRETIEAQAKALSLGLDKKVLIHTPLMDMDKADIWDFSYRLGGNSFQKIITEETHSCYIGDRLTLHSWGYGCDNCPACQLRKDGYNRWILTK